MARLSRPLIGGIACLILLLAVAWNNESTLIVMLLILLLGLNLAILISNFKNIKSSVKKNINVPTSKNTPNQNEEEYPNNLPDPLEKGFNLPL